MIFSRGHWRTSIQLALLFVWPLLACRSAPPGAGKTEAYAEDFPRQPGQVEFERWFDVLVQGQVAGSWHFAQFAAAPGRKQLNSRVELRFLDGREPMHLLIEEDALVTEDFRLLRFRSHERAEEALGLEAGICGGRWSVKKGPETRSLPWRPEAKMLFAYRSLFPGQPPRAGQEREFVAFDSERGEYVTAKLKIVSCTPGENAICQAELTTDAEPQLVTRLRLDAELEPQEITSRLGGLEVTFRRRPAASASAPSEPPRLDTMRAIPAPSTLGDLSELERVTLRLGNLPPGSADRLPGPGQRVIGSAGEALLVEVSRSRLSEAGPWPLVVPQELRPWTVPTALVRSDDAEIAVAARRAVAGAKTALEAAQALRRLVSEKIRPVTGRSLVTSRGVWKTRQGDCDEQTLLLVSLARSLGIPARAVAGLIWNEGYFFHHMWAELWLGEWYPLDPAQATDGIGPGWLRLTEFPLGMQESAGQDTAGLELVLSDLKIEILAPKAR